jgi:hypothetical protein
MNVFNINNRSRRFIILIGLIGLLALTPREGFACSSILVGKKATSDGSVLMSSSCDGDIMGLIYVMPAQKYPQGTKLPMYWNLPRPKTYQEYLSNLRKGYDLVGYLPVKETYRSIILGGNVENMTTGGINEHGAIRLSILPRSSCGGGSADSRRQRNLAHGDLWSG